MNKAISVISIILGVVLLVGIAFGVYVLLEATDYFKAKPTNFWLKIDGQRYNADSEIELTQNSIAVNYLVGWLSGKKGYTYELVPVDEDFIFEVDGEQHNWLEQDINAAFDVTEYDNGFIITSKNTLQELLQALYSEQTVTVKSQTYSCKLVVTSVDGKAIDLTIRGKITIDNIELNPPTIVF